MPDLREFNGRPIIIGGGVAGLMTALHLAPEPVLLLSRGPIGEEGASPLAQGGLAAALGNDDHPALHLVDTLVAGDGLCDPEITSSIVDAAHNAIAVLARLGVRFDRAPKRALRLGQEAAHSRRRIVHAQGDRTGWEIIRALAVAVRNTPSVAVIEGLEARRLIVEDNAVAGVLAAGSAGQVVVGTHRVVIATGGIGGLFLETTNPRTCFGHGLALAARAGADLADLEFVQFHPTAFDGLPFAARFPGIAYFCRGAGGLDPATQLSPIRPAAHYHMGGIAVDVAGRSSVEGLWACGEAACTGLHGANRLAGNSLTEAAVCAVWVAHSVAGTLARHTRARAAEELPPAPNPSCVRPIVSRALGPLRNREGISAAIAELVPIASTKCAASDPACIALMIAIAALRREESRGSHYRRDFPERSAVPQRSVLRLGEAFEAGLELASKSAPDTVTT